MAKNNLETFIARILLSLGLGCDTDVYNFNFTDLRTAFEKNSELYTNSWSLITF